MENKDWLDRNKQLNRTELIGEIPFTPGEVFYLRKHIGEQIAQEIEDTECQVGKGGECVCKGLDLAAAIARGNK